MSLKKYERYNRINPHDSINLLVGRHLKCRMLWIFQLISSITLRPGSFFTSSYWTSNTRWQRFTLSAHANSSHQLISKLEKESHSVQYHFFCSDWSEPNEIKDYELTLYWVIDGWKSSTWKMTWMSKRWYLTSTVFIQCLIWFFNVQ